MRQFVTAGRLAFARYESRSTVQLEAWERQFEAAAASVRVVGDVSGGPLARRPVADLVEYERRYDELSRRFAVSSLCLYDAARLSGVDTAHLLTGHDNLYRPPAMPRSVG